MSDVIKGISTTTGVKKIDYQSLANLPTIDSTPKEDSTNAVQSKGVYSALQKKMDTSGGTFTGGIEIATNYRPSVYFNADDARRAQIFADDDSNYKLTLRVFPPDYDSSKYNSESYYLPVPDTGLTEAKHYAILTAKNAVRVGQGGTGATDDMGARLNLGTNVRTYTSPGQFNPDLSIYSPVADICAGMPIGSIYLFDASELSTSTMYSSWGFSVKPTGYIQITKSADAQFQMIYATKDGRLMISENNDQGVPNCKWHPFITDTGGDFTGNMSIAMGKSLSFKNKDGGVLRIIGGSQSNTSAIRVVNKDGKEFDLLQVDTATGDIIGGTIASGLAKGTDKLWENAKPTDSFATQNIQIDNESTGVKLSDYVGVWILYRYNASYNTRFGVYIPTGLTDGSGAGDAMGYCVVGTYQQANQYLRAATVWRGKVQFGSAYLIGGGANPTNYPNDHAIPIAIYGIK